MNALALVRHPMGTTLHRLKSLAGGSTRARVLLLLACVLGLDTADVSMIGAIAGKLESAFSLSNTELGLLAAVPSAAAVVATIPAGVLTDRLNRVRLIAGSALLWSVAMVASGLAQSFAMLLVTRIALGLAVAAASPAIASLVGDYFAPRERARMYGLVLSGELIGAGFGFVVSGEFASGFTWRSAFFVLALPSLAVALAVWRLLPEPPRGGNGYLRPQGHRSSGRKTRQPPGDRQLLSDRPEETLVQRKVAEQDVAPDESLVLRKDPAAMSLRIATRYVLRVRTNVVLIVASALGYFYLNGVETFGLVFLQGRFHLSHSAATLLLSLLGVGALVGVLSGGRAADRLVARGRLDGRILVGAVGALATACLFLPALLTTSLAVALPLLVLASAAFAGRNPALDAARLDIMHHRLWGRAEAVRTVLRRLMVAAAPLVFGWLADNLSSGHTSAGTQRGFGAAASSGGLRVAFLILLVSMPVAALLTFRARRTYPTDVSTARESEAASSPPAAAPA